MSACHVSAKGLTVFRIYKELLKTTIKRQPNLKKKKAKDLNRSFPKDTQMAKKHRKQCSVT